MLTDVSERTALQFHYNLIWLPFIPTSASQLEDLVYSSCPAMVYNVPVELYVVGLSLQVHGDLNQSQVCGMPALLPLLHSPSSFTSTRGYPVIWQAPLPNPADSLQPPAGMETPELLPTYFKTRAVSPVRLIWPSNHCCPPLQSRFHLVHPGRALEITGRSGWVWF